MRLVRYRDADRGPVYGELADDRTVRPVSLPPFAAATTRHTVDLDSVELLAPVTPRTVVCVGRNYRAHAEEFSNPAPEEPLLFLKPATSVIGPGATVTYPNLSARLDPEAELVVVIGRHASRVPRERAWDVIGGYTCGNDVTARDIQKSDGQWTRGKGFRGFCPLGPWLTTEYDPTDVVVTCTVNGERRQDGRTRDLLFDIGYLIEYITRFVDLEPGDVILTGTPEGVGPVSVGDEVTVEVAGLGALTNRIVAE